MATVQEQETLNERSQLIGDFCRETEESLDALEHAVESLRPFVCDIQFNIGIYIRFLHGMDVPVMMESLRVVNRLVHTVKGVSSFLDLPHINAYCHTVEELTIGLTRGQLYMDRGVYGVIVAIPVVLNRFLEAVREQHSDESVNVEAELAAVSRCREEMAARMGGAIIHFDEIEGKDLGRIHDFKRDLRVNIQLPAYDGILQDYQAFAQDIVQAMKARQTDMAVMQRIEKGLTEHLERLLLASRGEIVLSRYPRLAIDLAAHLGKKVDFTIRRNEAWARPDIWDRCHNALVHMVRNSVDHGIEMPAEREAAGKSANGNVWLDVYEDFRNLYLTLEDDGKGIDPQHVGQVAVEKGVIRPEQLASMNDEEKQRLIFHSGFSTRREASNVSGRGVGMDAVLKEIESHLNGRVRIDSRVGRGTCITLEIPKVETLSECICFGDAAHRYAIPVVADVRYLECEQRRLKQVLGRTTMYISEDGEFPVLNLFPQLHPEEYSGMSMNLLPIIQIGRDDKAIGVVVPQIYGQERIKIDRRRQLRKLTRDNGLIFGYGLTDPITVVLDLDFLQSMI